MSDLLRIRDMPNLAEVVPQMRPDLLHQIIRQHGLEDCGDIVALATPEQLQQVLDLDLWRAPRPGSDEQLDGERFAVWLEVLIDAGAAIGAGKLAQMDPAFVAVAVAQLVRVFDVAAGVVADEGPSCEIGGYLIASTHAGAWGALVDALIALDAEQPAYFHEVMRRCRALSNSDPEIDGLDDLLTDREQALFEAAVDREERRIDQGFVPPAQAQAFLQQARHHTSPATGPSSHSTALVRSSVQDGDRRNPRLAAFVQAAFGGDEGAHASATQDLVYLANALVSGCPFQGRAFTPHEASEAAAAICNLGLENGNPPPGRPLVAAFEAGWTRLYRNVCMYTAERLADILGSTRCGDPQIQDDLDGLRIELTKQWRAGTPWRARTALEPIAVLDMPSWAGLLGLLDECPVAHAAIAASRNAGTRAVSPTAFEFIADSGQIAAIRSFVDGLPAVFGIG